MNAVCDIPGLYPVNKTASLVTGRAPKDDRLWDGYLLTGTEKSQEAFIDGWKKYTSRGHFERETEKVIEDSFRERGYPGKAKVITYITDKKLTVSFDFYPLDKKFIAIGHNATVHKSIACDHEKVASIYLNALFY